MARVYQAFDSQLQRTVALKVLAPQLAVDPEFAERFEREAITAANLHHQNIVIIYDVGEQDGLRYFAMEYVAGRTLHAIIQERGALGLGPAVSITAAVGAALDYAHTNGSVHRDIKPHNIMISTDGRVLLTDFGIAQAPDRGEGGDRLTRTGVFMGTPEYISPEQASGQRLDGRSDLYSLGITAYEMITGRVPFAGATPQLIVAHVQEAPPPPTSLDSSLPSDLDTVMNRILAKRPEQRFATARAFADALRIVARHRGITPADKATLARLAAPLAVVPTEPTTIGSKEVTQRDPVRAAPPERRPPPDRVPQRPATVPPESQRRAASELPHTTTNRQPFPSTVARNTLPRSAHEPWWNNIWPGWLIIGVAVVLLIFLIGRGAGNGPLVLPTNTPAPVASIRPTLSPTPTDTPTPTATPTITPTLQATAILATPTNVFATPPPFVIPNTPIPLPQPTPEPPTPEPPTPTIEQPTVEPPTATTDPNQPTAEPPTVTPDANQPTSEPPASSTPAPEQPTTSADIPTAGTVEATVAPAPPTAEALTAVPATSAPEPPTPEPAQPTPEPATTQPVVPAGAAR